jgi:hypothetical protein
MAKIKVRYNWVKIKKKIAKNATKNRKLLSTVTANAENRLRRAKRELIKEFDSHPVTLEIEGGPDAFNSTGLLGGYGNLFSFIGFHEEEDPIELVRQLLSVSELMKPTVIQKRGSVEYKFRVVGMTKSKLFAATRLGWLGKSWLQGIESGLSGLGQYMHDDPDYIHGNSRSGTGIQSRVKIRGGGYTPTRYISALIRNFEKKLK